MAHILEQLSGAFATLGLVLVAGYAPARLLLPSNLQRWFWLAVPLLGYATSAVVLGWLSIFLPLSSGAWLFLGATIGVSALVLLRGGLPPGDQAWLGQAMVATLAVIALGIGLLPLWDRPELLAIGPNWDIEIYLPLAEYLKQFSTGFSLTDPAGLPFPGEPNPLLWRINFFDPRWAGLAFSQLHAVIGVALHQEAHQQFAGVLALLGALSVPAVFLFFRAAFGLDRTPSLLATTLLALNPATLYVLFWSFGQQAASLPLVPLALLTGLLALRRPGVRAALLAGLSLAALLATFIPAGLLYGLPFAALALYAGISSHQRSEVISATLGILGTSLVLAPWAYLRGVLRAYHFLQEGGATGLTVGPDVTRFPPVTWALGLAATPEGFSAGLPEPLSGVTGSLITLFSLLLGGLMVAALIVAFRRKNAPLLVCSLALLALLGSLRFVMPYPYGYLKLLPSGGFILIGLLVAGGWALWHTLPASALRLALRLGLSGGGLALLGATLLSAGGLIASMKHDSTAAYRGFEALSKLVPAGSSVYLSGHEAYQGPKTGALAYFLRHAKLYGALRTGFSTFYRLRTDGVYDYAVFYEGEPIPKELYSDKEMVWQGLDVKVFRTPQDVAYFRDFGAASRPPTIEQTAGQGGAAGLRITRWQPSGYPDFSGWSPPLLGVLAETARPSGGYLQIAGGATAEVLIPESAGAATRGSTEAARTPSGGPQTLVVTIASFAAQQATVSVNGQPQGLTVAPGVASYPLGALRTPAQLTLQTQPGRELFVRSILVKKGNPATEKPASFPEAALTRWQVNPGGEALALYLDYLGPDYQLVVDIYSRDGQRHYGWWSLPDGGAERDSSYHLRLDLRNQAAYLVQQRQETKLPGWQGERGDGDYRAYLFFWKGDQAVRSVPLFEFALSGDTVTGVKQGSGGLFIG